MNEKGRLIEMRLKIIDTEKFLNMPVSTKCLYYELLHKTHEKNNVCKNLAKVLKRGNYAQDDIVMLIERGFAEIVQEGIKLKI